LRPAGVAIKITPALLVTTNSTRLVILEKVSLEGSKSKITTALDRPANSTRLVILEKVSLEGSKSKITPGLRDRGLTCWCTAQTRPSYPPR
jgi:hypothetical protein